MKIDLNSPLTLPCGVTLKNRLVKAAMTERMSNERLEPTEMHHKLYAEWAKTGVGLMITGNVMFDDVHLESGGNVFLGDEDKLPLYRAWAAAAKQNDTQVLVQISHAGRQTNRFNALRPKAPSEVHLKKIGLFGRPREMTEDDIAAVITGFVHVAKIVQAAGFDGVQIHAAHGYLLSQFLSPKTNQRTDQWGGSLENRSRLLLTVVREVRSAVGAQFPISVKLNSSDFQRGGFSEEDALAIVEMLDREKIDLLEISGGTYEMLAFLELNTPQPAKKESTRRREAYFIDFAKKIRAVSQLPLMITGGFRSNSFCNEVLAAGELDLIGMARPFLTNLDQIPGFLKGDVERLDNYVIRTTIPLFQMGAEGGYYANQLLRIADGKAPNLKMNPTWASTFVILWEARKALARRMA